MDLDLHGKVALVCAASKGLGRAAARSLAGEGCRLAICARHAEPLQETAGRIARDTGAEVLPIVADVSQRADVARLVAATVDRFGGLDILVTNAGGPKSGLFDTLTEADWRGAFDVTFLSVVLLCLEAVPHLRRRGGGRIINITSVSVKQPIDGLMLSNALRAAVTGFSKTLANELARDGILVNCVAPGYTRTDRVTELVNATASREGLDPAAVAARLVGGVPLGRAGEPRELGDLVAFLASARGSYITGTTIQVDGGTVKGLL
ncbi:MAG TPA: SDR family oxidoreductase [Vicinamibacterales bacterium]|nr:SDR family oxidoreductase [Vicinamibacterales bacterium]